MSIEQSSQKNKRKRAKAFLPLLTSAIFLAAIIALYGSLGTFVSSCGEPTSYEETTLSFGQGTPICNMPTSGGLVYLSLAISQNWKLRIVVSNQATGAALRTYDFYQSNNSTNTTGATISTTTVSGIEIPSNGISYSVTAILGSYCGCSAGVNEAHYWRCTVNFPAGQNAGAPLGSMGYWDIMSCTQFF